MDCVPLLYHQIWCKQALSMSVRGYVVLEDLDSGDLFPGFFRDSDQFPILAGTGYVARSVVLVESSQTAAEEEEEEAKLLTTKVD